MQYKNFIKTAGIISVGAKVRRVQSFGEVLGFPSPAKLQLQTSQTMCRSLSRKPSTNSRGHTRKLRVSHGNRGKKARMQVMRKQVAMAEEYCCIHAGFNPSNIHQNPSETYCSLCTEIFQTRQSNVLFKVYLLFLYFAC